MKHNITLVGTPQRTDKNGFQALRLRVSFNSKSVFLPVGVKWTPENIHPDGITQGTQPKKKFIEAVDKIEALQNKIDCILEDLETITPTELKLRILSNSHGDFIAYAKNKLLERVRNLELQASTYRVQTLAVNSFAEFKPNCKFSDIDPRLIESYKIWLKKNGMQRNTIWTRLKDIRTYMNAARKDGIKFNYPFGESFKFPKPQSRLEFLGEAEFLQLKQYFETTENTHHKEVLRAFMFSCYTGLRISDVVSIRGKTLQGDVLIFEPLKTALSETKKFTEIKIPLHPYCIKILPDKMAKEAVIFSSLPNKNKINIRLKEIAQACKIEPFSFHYSRHTFATRFLRYGGKIEVLKDLLGHESISTTMIYTHIETSHAENQINLIP
jgi:integrase